MFSKNLIELEEEPNWRVGLETHAKVMSHVLCNGLYANAVLEVGKDKVRIPIIKEILAPLSPILEGRVMGPYKEVDANGLPIFYFPYVKVQHMKKILQCAYTHEWGWSGKVKDIDSLLSFRGIVERLEIKNLARKVNQAVENLTGLVDETTACCIFESAKTFRVKKLEHFALDFILRNGTLIFSKLDNFGMLNSFSLVEILERDNLQIGSELTKFIIAETWAEAKCVQMGMEPINENVQEILDDVLYYLQSPKKKSETKKFENGSMTESQLNLNHKSEGKTVKIPSPQSQSETTQDIGQLSTNNHVISQTPPDPSISILPLVDPEIELLLYQIEDFGSSQKDELLDLLNQYQSNYERFFKNSSQNELFQIDLESIPEPETLINFLQTIESSLKLHLKIGTILPCSIFKCQIPTQPTPFPFISSLTIESLEEKTQLECLTWIVQSSPNLCDLTIGNFSVIVKHTDLSYANLNQFLRSVPLKNVQLSLGLLGSLDFTRDLFRQLISEGVTFKKISYNGSTITNRFDILQEIHTSVQEIHDFYHRFTIRSFDCVFFKLKLFAVRCNAGILLKVTKAMPNLEKLIWHCESSSSPSMDQTISLKRLKVLVVFLKFPENSGHVAQLFGQTNLKLQRLTCINFCGGSIEEIFKKFSGISRFRYIQSDGVTIERLGGSTLLDGKGQDKVSLQNFGELTSLSFRYKNYQHQNLVGDWNVDAGELISLISQLGKLKSLTLPPMKREVATKTLELLASFMKQLKKVTLQVWSSQKETSDEMMNSVDIEIFRQIYREVFQIEEILVRPMNSCKSFWY